MSVPRFLVSSEALRTDRAVISGSELHHLRVRRVRIGSPVTLTDGQGQERCGVLTALGREQAVVSLTPFRAARCESRLRLVLAQAVLKADKMDWVIEKATELGVAEFIVFVSEHSLGKPSAERQARWNRIARSAAKQSQRSVVPAVRGPFSFQELLLCPGDMRLLFWEGTQRDLPTVPALTPSSALVAVIGPEGGFTLEEAARAESSGFHSVTLGPRILRAETAALVAVSLCQYRWGDLGSRAVVA